MSSDEWYTPEYILDAARQVMGFIELDPASTEEANRYVKAQRIYTKDNNALEQDWQAMTVWLNPPYGRNHNVSIIRLFIEKLKYHYLRGDVGQAIILTTADIDELWWRQLVPYPVCFPDHKVYYFRPGKDKEKHIFGTALTYMGMNEQRFIDIFGEIGPVYRCVSRIKEYPMRYTLEGL